MKGSVEENWEKKEFKKFYPHKIGHHLGLDTHDPCPYYTFGGPTKLEEGHIITIEPGIYTEDFGVRIEDDILITNSGCKII